MASPLFDPLEHEPLASIAWDSKQAKSTLQSIIAETEQAFRPKVFWPEHPADSDWSPGVPMTSLFWGAASVSWTHCWLKEKGAVASLDIDHEKLLRSAYETYCQTPDSDARAPGYLFGDSGILTVLYRFFPTQKTADLLYEKVKETIPRPENELMWAAPGAIISAKKMFQLTQDERWNDLLIKVVDRLFSTWNPDPVLGTRIWIQDLYGQVRRYLGAVHGFAGNVYSLLEALPFLSPEQVGFLLEQSQKTLLKTAWVDGPLANWLPAIDSNADSILVQWCHGAPGMITSFNRFPKDNSPQLESLLLKAGELVWHAGPLRKPFGLCHGTAGNGFAFLKLYDRTGEKIWLDRARSFAMHAIAQSDTQMNLLGRRRYGLFTGDTGLAYYLWCCMSEKSEWPLFDVI